VSLDLLGDRAYDEMREAGAPMRPHRPGRGNLRDLDDELMARAAEGERAAWNALYVRHRDRVFRIALRFLGDEPTARDVTQDVFISLFAHARSYRQSGSFPGYLRRMTVNRCVNARASAHAAHRVSSSEAALRDIADRSPDPEARLQHEQTAAAVRAAIAELPPRQRMAVVLSRFEGLSYEEIASALECSISSVESLLFRARQALANSLAP
jgi:RNA polymerase sigma-70 factor (ECF subfamily)